MKKVILYCLIMFSSLFAQKNIELLQADSIEITDIKNIFDNAYFDTKLNKGVLKFKDTWTISVDMDKSHRFITYYVVWKLDPKATELDKLKLVNQINREVLLVAPYVSLKNNIMMIKYDLWIEGGVTPKNIIRTEKIFKQALELILKKDIKRVIM